MHADHPTHLYIVRHGETLSNVKGFMGGWTDTPITPRGMEQAWAAGRALAGVTFDAAFTSDLGRARTTALAIVEAGDSALVPEPLTELREWNFGRFEGRPPLEMWSTLMDHLGIDYLPAEVQARSFWGNLEFIKDQKSVGDEGVMDALVEVDPTGSGEGWATYSDRLHRAVTHLGAAAQHSPGGNILVVSHGATIRTLLTLVDPAGYNGEDVGNASISHLTYHVHDGRFSIHSIGEMREAY